MITLTTPRGETQRGNPRRIQREDTSLHRGWSHVVHSRPAVEYGGSRTASIHVYLSPGQPLSSNHLNCQYIQRESKRRKAAVLWPTGRWKNGFCFRISAARHCAFQVPEQWLKREPRNISFDRLVTPVTDRLYLHRSRCRFVVSKRERDVSPPASIWHGFGSASCCFRLFAVCCSKFVETRRSCSSRQLNEAT